MKSVALNVRKSICVFISMLVFTLSLTSYASTGAFAVNTSKSYTIFCAQGDEENETYKAGDYMGGYTLDANPITDNSRYTVLNDERYAEDGVVGAVKIILDDGTIGSGFIIDAHTIGTAAHCVFNKTRGSQQNSGVGIDRILIFDSNGNILKTITTAYDVHVPNKFISIDEDSAELCDYDYAMITITETLAEDYLCFNLGVMNDSMVGTDLAIYSTGFPGIVDGKLVNGYDEEKQQEVHGKYTDFGKVVSATDRCFYYDNDISGGDSGGAAYVKATYGGKDYLTIVGITTVSTSSDGVTHLNAGGVRMTTELLHFYKNNPYIEY